MLAYYLLLLAYPIYCSLLAYLLHTCHNSLLIRLFAPRMPQALSSHAYLLRARHSSLICLFAPYMPQALSSHAYLLHACHSRSLLVRLFALCMPRALSLRAYLLHACRKLSPSPICSMLQAPSFLTHLLHACHELSVAVLPHACPSVRAARRRFSSSRPDRRTTSPRSSPGTPPGPSPTTPTNA